MFKRIGGVGILTAFLGLLTWSAFLQIGHSQTRLDPAFRAELSSDSTNTPDSVKVVIDFSGQQDTFRLQPTTVDSLEWDTTLVNLDSAGVYSVTYLAFYKDGQVVPYNEFVTVLATASVSAADKDDIASRTADTLAARGFVSSGVGGNRCSVLVRDTVNAVNVPGVYVLVYNSGGSVHGAQSTDGTGYAWFNMNNGTYYLRPSKTGWVFPVQDTFVVSGASVDTISGYPFSPGAPPLAYTQNVWGWFFDITGSGKSGILVSAMLNRWSVERGGVLVSNYKVSDTTDTAGYWQLTVINNDSILPVGTEYKFEASDSGRTVGRVAKAITADQQLDWTR